MTHEPFTGFLQGNITAQRDHKPQGDPVNPDYYKEFSNGAEVIALTLLILARKDPA